MLATRRPVQSVEHPPVDRRGPSRPLDGDTRPCPICKGVMEFLERYRMRRSKRRSGDPGWLCSSPECGHFEHVRQERTRS
jgi:hypothetical protein